MPSLHSSLRSPLRSPLYSPLVGKWGAVDPFALLQYDIDFAAGTAKGVTQGYGDNNNDGRAFRDQNNFTATFCPTVAGGSALVSCAASGLRRTIAGHWAYSGGSSRALWNRDMTNVAWVATNMTVAKNQAGANGAANSASSLTATAGNATILQAITLASSQQVYSVDIKRLTGTGNIDLTVDGGTTWATITGLTASYQQKFITQAAVTNPVFGIRIVTSGDAVAVDFNHIITPAIAGVNIPNQYRWAVTTASINPAQSRAVADAADNGPLNALLLAPYAFYWQGRSERSSSAGIITGITDTFITGSTAGVSFAQGGGTATTAAALWNVGLGSVNKVAGFVSGGTIHVCANGGAVASAGGATFPASLDHWDGWTNGSGARNLCGVTERFAISPSLAFTDAQLIAMTT